MLPVLWLVIEVERDGGSPPKFATSLKVGKIGPLECCWTTSFGVRPDKELCGLKPYTLP